MISVSKSVLALLIAFLMTGLVIANNPDPSLHPADLQALQSIRQSLSDLPGSAFFSNSWDFGLKIFYPCNFTGVACTAFAGFSRVTRLELGDSTGNSPGLTGKLDPAIGDMSALVQVNLAPGKVTGSLPDSLGKLTSLQYLGLGNNYFTGLIPSSLVILPRLRILDLSYNRLEGNIPFSVNLPNLTTLVLSHNLLSGSINPNFLSNSPFLLHLDLSHNSFYGSLNPLPSSLNYLLLSHNYLFGTLDFTQTLMNLTWLDLSFNQFTGSIPPAVFALPRLNSLLLNRNFLSGPVSPPGLVQVPMVDLSYNKLSGDLPPFLAFSRDLYLNNNFFTGAVPQEFTDQLMSGATDSGLKTLYLQHNYLSEFKIDPNLPLPATSSVCIQYNCILPPMVIKSTCPIRAGRQLSRPPYQCHNSSTPLIPPIN